MSVMSDLDLQLQTISEVMSEPADNDPEVSADMACQTALNALDDLMVLAANQKTSHLVWANKIFIGQILTRAQLVASVLMAVEQEAGKLRMVHGR